MFLSSFFMLTGALVNFGLIRFLLKNNFFQPQRKEENKTCLIPTFGGFSFLIILILLFILNKIDYMFFLYVIFIGCIGLFDDFLKVYKKNTDGVKSSLKIKLEFFASFVFLFFQNYHRTYLIYPVFSLFFCTFFLVSMINAVNLSDGMDGVASILSVFCLLFLYFKTWDILCLYFIFMIFGFLIFNFPKAKIYMGDVGALSLGAILGVLFFQHKLEWSIFFVGIVFVIETLSSFIQIFFIRLFSKKIFLLAPFHHHLLLKNWTKSQVMLFFYFLTLFGFFFSLYLF